MKTYAEGYRDAEHDSANRIKELQSQLAQFEQDNIRLEYANEQQAEAIKEMRGLLEAALVEIPSGSFGSVFYAIRELLERTK